MSNVKKVPNTLTSAKLRKSNWIRRALLTSKYGFPHYSAFLTWLIKREKRAATKSNSTAVVKNLTTNTISVKKQKTK